MSEKFGRLYNSFSLLLQIYVCAIECISFVTTLQCTYVRDKNSPGELGVACQQKLKRVLLRGYITHCPLGVMGRKLPTINDGLVERVSHIVLGCLASQENLHVMGISPNSK